MAGRGIEGRQVVGVAHDGEGFVWHEWAELRVDGRWWAVDPAFRQAPARAAAGRSVLACWGRARVAGGR